MQTSCVIISSKDPLSDIGPNHLGLIAVLFQSVDNLVFVLCTKGFQSDTKFHRCISVDRDKMGVLQLYGVIVLLCYQIVYWGKFALFI